MDAQIAFSTNGGINAEYLNVKQAAEYLSITSSAVYKLCSRRIIPYYQPGGKIIYFRRSDLNEYISSRRIASNVEVDRAAEFLPIRKSYR